MQRAAQPARGAGGGRRRLWRSPLWLGGGIPIACGRVEGPQLDVHAGQNHLDRLGGQGRPWDPDLEGPRSGPAHRQARHERLQIEFQVLQQQRAPGREGDFEG